MRLRTLGGGLALAASIVAPTVSATAGEATDALRAFFAEGRRIIMEAIEREDPEAGIAAARQLIHRAFDVRQAASRVLGREWELRTPAEQDEFVRLFTDLMERAYLSHVIARLNREDAIRVNYLDETITGDTAVVDTTVESRAGIIPFQYRMARSDGRWTVRDVVVDGVSIVESYRAQFARVLRGSSYAETIAALRERYTPPTIVAAEPGPAPPSSPSDASRTVAATPRVRVRVRQPEASAGAPALSAPRSSSGALTAAVDGKGGVTVERISIDPRTLDTDRVAPAAPRDPALSKPTSTRPTMIIARPGLASPRKPPPPTYWVQVGAFKDESVASRVIAQLGSAAVTIATAADSLLRLRLGPYPDRTTAISTLRALQDRGFQPFVIETR